MVSVVIPLYNEEAIIDLMMDRLTALDRKQAGLEFVFANDGSRDATSDKMLRRLPELKQWQLIHLARNFGQQSAYRAGLMQAQGDAVVFLDADLQDPPELIPELIALWEKGAKVVVACRRTRKEKGLRGFAMRSFHRLFHRLTHGVMPENSGTFGLMDRVVADHLRQMPELSVFFQALRCWVGYRREIFWYDREERIGGEVKQSYSRLLRQAWDAITSFSEIPLQSISVMGVLVSLFGFAYAGFLLAIKALQFFGKLETLQVPGFTTVAVAVLCLGGIQLISIGILGEYLARIYQEVKRRPSYLVERIDRSGV